MVDEKIFTIPLKRIVVKQTRTLRAKRAVNEIKSFLIKHTKSKDVKISKGINELVWSHGAKKPPGKIRVKVKKDGDVAWARLMDEKDIMKKEEAKGRLETLKERLGQSQTPTETFKKSEKGVKLKEMEKTEGTKKKEKEEVKTEEKTKEEVKPPTKTEDKKVETEEIKKSEFNKKSESEKITGK